MIIILEIKGFTIVVNIVTIRQLKRATFKNMLGLSMIGFNIVVNIVTIRQQPKFFLRKHVRSV